MHRDKRRKCDDRIVSISHPHVRPIVRDKAKKTTEFGAKISVSMRDGLAFVDKIGWDAFNEGKFGQGQIVTDQTMLEPEVNARQRHGSIASF